MKQMNQEEDILHIVKLVILIIFTSNFRVTQVSFHTESHFHPPSLFLSLSSLLYSFHLSSQLYKFSYDMKRSEYVLINTLRSAAI
jgi:hypothetical protein